MIGIEIGKPVVTVSIRISDRDGRTTAEDWKNLASDLKKSLAKLAKVGERFKDVHYVDYVVRIRGDFDVEGSEEEIENIVKTLKQIAVQNKIELEIK